MTTMHHFNFQMVQFISLVSRLMQKKGSCLNPLTPEDFYIFEWFSAYKRSIGFRDSIFRVTMKVQTSSFATMISIKKTEGRNVIFVVFL